MKGKFSLYDWLSLIFWIAVGIICWIDAKKTFGTAGTIAMISAVFAAFGLLFALDRYWQKRKSEQWMSRYHICLAVVFGLAILVVIFVVLRFYA